MAPFTLHAVTPAAPGSDTDTWLGIRDLTDHEAVRLRCADAMFKGLLERHPLTDLKAGGLALHEAIDHFMNTDRWPDPAAEQRLRRAFKIWLSAFRSFDDRTKVWIKAHFSADHPAYTAFKQRLRTEHKHSFAYRLASQLRNISEHHRDPINVLTTRYIENADRSLTRILTLGFDTGLLATEAGKGKLNAKVHSEMLANSHIVGLQPMCLAVIPACERAYATHLLAIWDNLEPLIATTIELHDEALESDGVYANAADLTRTPRNGKCGLIPIRADQAHALNNIKQQAVALLEGAIPSVSPEDLVAATIRTTGRFQ